MKQLRYFLLILLFTGLSTLINAQIWTQVGSDINGETGGDNSGWSVSLSSDASTIAIGAPNNEDNGIFAGHVRVFENIDGTWTQIGSDIDGEATGDFSGVSLSLSSDASTLAIGAVWNDGNGTSSGHVRVYENSGGTWTQIGSDIDGDAPDDYCGSKVSLSADGTVLAVSSRFNDTNGTDAGQVKIYHNNSGTWTQIGSDIYGEAAGDEFGYSLSLSPDASTVAIGAYYNDGNGTSSGHVRVYENISGNWTKIGDDIDGEAAGDHFGTSISLNYHGSVLAVGALGNDDNGSNAGHVRVFENIGGNWTQIGGDIDGEASDDWLGYSVSLSHDGLTIAAGAPKNAGNGTTSGHTRVFKNISGNWTQIGLDIDGETPGSESGFSVSLNSSGSTVAVGARFNNGSGIDSGQTRVFYNSSFVNIETSDQTGISIYPNPTSGSIEINCGNKEFVKRIKISDISGKILLSIAYSSNDTQLSLDLSKYKCGLYIINILTDKGVLTKKIVKR